MRNFRTVTRHYAEEIVQIWIDYFILHRLIDNDRATEDYPANQAILPSVEGD